LTDTAATRNAAQAFDTRSGNCLSLVIMTAAFAKELGLQVQYQSAFVDETWSRSNNLYFASGHVNLTLGKRLFDAGGRFDTGRLITIDFLSADEARRQRTRAITEATIIAMYMNNRSAEALVQGRLDDAYAWARAAIAQSPTFLSAYNTLGVIYLRHGNLPEAERVLAEVLAREPDNTPALSNLAQTIAIDNSTTARDHDLYAAKLGWINAERAR
jgi:tetratricopeptide (TPR) repeat protein